MKRLGRFIGTARDLFVDLNKYFIIMFYDIILLDDTVSFTDFYDRRRYLLKSLIHYNPGRADIKNRKVINFSFFDISQLLSKVFTRAII
jgi:hypothetical protein